MSIENRLRKIEKKLFDNQGSITEVVSKQPDGTLIFGKTRKMKNAKLKTQ